MKKKNKKARQSRTLERFRKHQNKKESELDQISVIVDSIVIIASKELQNIINFDIYKNQLVSKSSTINELNMIANSMTKDYQSKDLPLVRVILPKQELKKRVRQYFSKVIDGFIEKINLEKVPKIQRKSVFRYLRKLKIKKISKIHC